MEFKIGDKVRVTNTTPKPGCMETRYEVGHVGVISHCNEVGDWVELDDRDDYGYHLWLRNIELVTSANNIMDLEKAYRNLDVDEPQKTFLETGVIDQDRNITEQGKKVFLFWLLDKHGTEFKKEFLDKITDQKTEEEN